MPPDFLQSQLLLADLEARHGLPRGLLDAVWLAESQRGHPQWMRSPKGAQGHFGLTPPTAKDLGVTDPMDFADAAQGAAKYLAKLQKRRGSLEAAVASYNMGPGAYLRRLGTPLPDETRDYVRKVLAGVRETPAAPAAKSAVDELAQRSAHINSWLTSTDQVGPGYD